MSKAKKCSGCGADMVVAREDYLYSESGLSDVILRDIEVRRCAACDEVQPVIPNIEGLHRTLVRMIVEQAVRLMGEEVRFLRTYLGLRSVDFARIMGVTKECVSRWENEKEQIGGTADRLLRMLVVQQKPVSDYSPERLTELLEGIREERQSLQVRLERRAGGWAEQRVAEATA